VRIRAGEVPRGGRTPEAAFGVGLKALFVALMALAWLSPMEIYAAAAPPVMRPYSGIGVLMLAVAAGTEPAKPEPLQLYEEPAITRLGELNIARIPAYEWIFGSDGATLPLIVTSRKGDWLRVAYDEAGREAWLNPRQRGAFYSWSAIFKGQTVRLLPGLQKRHYQLFRQPGKGVLGVPNPKQLFRVVKLENDWTLVMSGQNALAWLRWRDEDGRLLIALERAFANQK